MKRLGPQCLISAFHDPFVNLAIEHWILTLGAQARLSQLPLLFLWRNRECVVVGKNQHPLREANLHWLRTQNVPLVRRLSGGGTVYHSMGNTNYTAFMSREKFHRAEYAGLMSRVLNTLGAPSTVSPRHDIVIGEHKVSGSAYKLVKDRAYHHGTMLLDADLGRLAGALRGSTKDPPGLANGSLSLRGGGVDSVPSPVRNIRSYNRALDHAAFCAEAAVAFADHNGLERSRPVPVDDAFLREYDAADVVAAKAVELRSWDWVFGQSPPLDIEFTVPHSAMSVVVETRHGRFADCRATGVPEKFITELQRYLRGKKIDEFVLDADVAHEDTLGRILHALRESLI